MAEMETNTVAGRPTTVEVVQTTRRMSFLNVHENELDTISVYNTQSTTFFSLGSACLSFGVALVLNCVFADKLSDVAKAISGIGIPFSVIFGIVFYWVAWVFQRNKFSNIQRIKNESQGSDQK